MLSCWLRDPELTDSEPGHLCCFSKVTVKCYQAQQAAVARGEPAGGPEGCEHREVVRAEGGSGAGVGGLGMPLQAGQKLSEGFGCRGSCDLAVGMRVGRGRQESG